MVLGICGMICLVADSAPGAEHRFDGVYTGKKVLVKGPASMCSAEENVSLTIHGETLRFTNSGLKQFLISFYPNRDGVFGENVC
jgi:hypothetical protein